MALKKEAFLSPGQPLQIAYPPDWQGDKSGDEDESEFFISSQPRYLTEGEISLLADYLKNIPGPRQILYTGSVLISESDPLLDVSQDHLDLIEKQEGLANTRYAPSGGTLPIAARVLLIRERGYAGGKHIAIAGA